MYICMHIHLNPCMYMYVYMYVYIDIYISMFLYMYIREYCFDLHEYVCMHIYYSRFLFICICVCVCVLFVCQNVHFPKVPTLQIA